MLFKYFIYLISYYSLLIPFIESIFKFYFLILFINFIYQYSYCLLILFIDIILNFIH